MTRFVHHHPFWDPFVRQSDLVVPRKWGWLFGFGLLMLLLGSFAIIYDVTATLVTVLYLGWIIIFGGFMQVFAAFYARHWSGFFLHLAAGILGVIVGFMLIVHPAVGAAAVTLLMAVYFLVSGAIRIVAAVAHRFEHWGWALLNGIVTLVLGAIIWSQWPAAAFWVLGLFVGIDLILAGWTLISLAMVARELPPRAAAAT